MFANDMNNVSTKNTISECSGGVVVSPMQIWTSSENGYYRLYLIMSTRVHLCTVLRLNKYNKFNIHSNLSEIILGEEEGLLFPSIPNISDPYRVKIEDLRTFVGTVNNKLYGTIVSLVADYMLGNIVFDSDTKKYDYVNDFKQQFRAPSRISIYEDYCKKYHADPRPDEVPMDKLPSKMNIETDSHSSKSSMNAEKQNDVDIKSTVESFVKEHSKEYTPYFNRDSGMTLEDAIDKFISGKHSVSNFDIIKIYNDISTGLDSSETTKKTIVKHSKINKNDTIEFDKNDLLYIITHKSILIASKYKLSTVHASTIKGKLMKIIYGDYTKRDIIIPDSDAFSFDDLRKLNPTKSIQALENYYRKYFDPDKSKRDINVSKRKAMFNYRFEHSREDIDKIQDFESIVSRKERASIIVDKYMYEVKDAIEQIVISVDFNDIYLSDDELIEKYAVPNMYSTVFCCLARNAFSKLCRYDFLTDEEIINCCSYNNLDYMVKTCKRYGIRPASVYAYCRRVLNERTNTIELTAPPQVLENVSSNRNILDIIRMIPTNDIQSFDKYSTEMFMRTFKLSKDEMENFINMRDFVSEKSGSRKNASRFLKFAKFLKNFSNPELHYLDLIASDMKHSYLYARASSNPNIEDRLPDINGHILEESCHMVFNKAMMFFSEEDFSEEYINQFKNVELEYQQERLSTCANLGKIKLITFDD